MKAIFTNKRGNVAQTPSGNKELINSWTVYGYKKGNKRPVQIVDARTYMGRSASSSVVYGCVWVTAGDYPSGRGQAGGWGYHKTSAAIADAISAAGIELYGSPYGEARKWSHELGREKTAAEMRKENNQANKKRCNFGGCGDSSLEAALMAIGAACRYEMDGKQYKFTKLFLGR